MAEEREYTQAAYDRHLRGRDEYPVVARRETNQYVKDPNLDPQRCREVFVGSMDRRSHSRGGVDEGSEQVGWWSFLWGCLVLGCLGVMFVRQWVREGERRCRCETVLAYLFYHCKYQCLV